MMLRDYELRTGVSIGSLLLNELALTNIQIVSKSSDLCYAHGRLLYSCSATYIKVSLADVCKNLTILETGHLIYFSQHGKSTF